MNKDDIIKALECCTKVREIQFCADEGCPYSSVPDCIGALMQDVLNLLKTQQPRVMALEEAQQAKVVWFEDRLTGELSLMLIKNNMNDSNLYKYGVQWRVWSARPTDEQREAVGWE